MRRRRSRAAIAAAVVFAATAIAACSSAPKATPATTSATTTVVPATTTVVPPTTAEQATTTTTAATTTTTSTPTIPASTDAPATTVAPVTPLTIQQLLHLGRPIVLAHAGGEDQHPHSTPYGYAESVKEGVDMLDFDVQLSRDGVLVVQHDDSTGRTANADVKIADTDYADLLKLDNAYWFTTTCTCTGQPDSAYVLRGIRTGVKPPPPGYSPGDFIIPRFSDIVQRFPTMPLNIEIKGNGAPAIAAARELAKELTDLHRLSNAVVASFDDSIVDTFHQLAPTVEVTPGLNAASAFFLNHVALPAGERILQVPPKYGTLTVLTPESMAAVHAAGYVVWVWSDDESEENPASYASLLQLGVDGLNINVPDQGVAAVKAFKR